MLRMWGLDVDQKTTIYRPDNQLLPEMERDESLPPLAGRSNISMHQSLLVNLTNVSFALESQTWCWPIRECAHNLTP